MTPLEFEQQVARIVKILVGDGALVTWNARIPDPDNPEQLRQIDVTVRRDNDFSLVECRLHARPQDVNWIEELFGRRASLRASAAIGVSASGFTSGALRKAEGLGIFVRSLYALSEEEIRSWGRRTVVRLSYVHFKRLSIFLAPSDFVFIPRYNRRTLMRQEDGQPFDLERLFRNAADRLSKDGVPEGIVRIQYFAKDLLVGSVRVPELILQVEWKWVHRDLSLPVVMSYGAPAALLSDRDALVEKDRFSATEVFHLKKGVTPIVDVSIAPIQPRSFLRRVLIDLGQPLPTSGVGIVGMDHPQASLFPMKIYLYRRESAEYRALFSGDELIL